MEQKADPARAADDLSTETPLESDQRFFVLKPYVFAAHKVCEFSCY